jgi:recombination protein RecR
MSSFLPESIQKVIDEFSRLPGIGPKSAQRLAMHLLHSPNLRVEALAGAVSGVKRGLDFCLECFNIAEGEKCRICLDNSRHREQICVVEEILDVMALEKTKQFKGYYHVLHGVLSPVDGIGPDQIKADELYKRVNDLLASGVVAGAVEVIVATNPSLEGETTAMYLTKLLKPLGVRVTRIARGLPAGGDLDYADEITLTRALQGRMEYI